MTDRQHILCAVSSAWGDLKRAIALVPQDDVDVPGVVGPWSVKDLIGHVATWDREALRALRRYLDDRDTNALVTWSGVDDFNAREADRNRNITLAELYDALEESHLRLVELISGLAEVDVGRSEVGTRIRVDAYGHYAEHTEQILLWLDAQGSTRGGQSS